VNLFRFQTWATLILHMKRLLLIGIIILPGCDLSKDTETYLDCELIGYLLGGRDDTESWKKRYPNDRRVSIFVDTENRKLITDGFMVYGNGDLNLNSTFEISPSQIVYTFQENDLREIWALDRVTLEASRYLNTMVSDPSQGLQWFYQCHKANHF